MSSPAWLMPPALDDASSVFLDEPTEFGSFWLLKLLGSGAFGDVHCAVRRRDFPSDTKLSCQEMYFSPAKKWAVKSFFYASDVESERGVAADIRDLKSPYLLVYVHEEKVLFENKATLTLA